MKIFKLILLFSLCVFLFLSCGRFKHNNVKDKKDSFYTNTGGFDRPRIPLIKPYELLKVSENEWLLELQTPILLTLSIRNVKGANVILDNIIIYSEGGTEFMNKQHNKAWFIIEAPKNKESAFENYTEFINAIKNKLNSDTAFKEPNQLYDFFCKNKVIKW